MKIVYLSRNMDGYQPANYQKEVMAELDRQADVFFYGPGFSGYEVNDSIEDIIAKSHSVPDAIILGHTWLNDQDGKELDPHPRIELEKTNILKAVILNKEYSNLDAKLDYIKRKRFNLGFTHHHDTERYSNYTGIDFIFWPFAHDPQRFWYSNHEKTIDVGFSGVLQNANIGADQTDIRVRIMNCFFLTFMDVPLIMKRRYDGMNIFWNALSRKKIGNYLNVLLGKRKHLDVKKYASLMQKTKVYINTLSPMGLVSPRFFECMAAGTLVFCEESELYEQIFPEGTYVSFRSDLRDFDEKLFHYLNNDSERNRIIKKANAIVKIEHTWAKRIGDLLNSMEKNY